MGVPVDSQLYPLLHATAQLVGVVDERRVLPKQASRNRPPRTLGEALMQAQETNNER